MTQNTRYIATLILTITSVVAGTVQAQIRSMPMVGSYGGSLGGFGAGLGTVPMSPQSGPIVNVGDITLTPTLPNVPTVHPNIEDHSTQTRSTTTQDRRMVPPPPPRNGQFVPPVVPDDDSDDDVRDLSSHIPSTRTDTSEAPHEDAGWNWKWLAGAAIVIVGWLLLRRNYPG